VGIRQGPVPGWVIAMLQADPIKPPIPIINIPDKYSLTADLLRARRAISVIKKTITIKHKTINNPIIISFHPS